MASSSSYYNVYLQSCEKIREYNKNIAALQKIKNNLLDCFYDEQCDANDTLDHLMDDLYQSVRHDYQFLTAANECSVYKEKTTMEDRYLNGAVVALENEIVDLHNKKSQEEQRKDSYYSQYQNAKEEERKNLLEAMKTMISISK